VRWLETGRTLLSLVILLKALSGIPSLAVGQYAPPAVTIFDSNPNHIWNRTYACLFIRQAPIVNNTVRMRSTPCFGRKHGIS